MNIKPSVKLFSLLLGSTLICSISNATSYTITPKALTGGTISPSTAQSVSSTTGFTWTAAPSGSGVVFEWQSNSIVVQTGGNTFNMSPPTAAATITVSFGYTITPSAGANGSISPSSTYVLSNSLGATFTATPSSGYAINQWTSNSVVEPTNNTIFVMGAPTAATTMAVAFGTGYTVTPIAGTGGTITPNYATNIVSTTPLTYSAATNIGGYIVSEWIVNGTPVQNGLPGYKFNALSNLSANATVQVTFEPMLMTNGTGSWTNTFPNGTNSSLYAATNWHYLQQLYQTCYGLGGAGTLPIK